MKTGPATPVAYLEGSMPEQWRQVYCGLTPFLVSDRGNVRLIDGSEPRMMLANGRYQIAYKPEEQHPSRRGRRGGMAHKKRVYRSVLVAMAFLDFKKAMPSMKFITLMDTAPTIAW